MLKKLARILSVALVSASPLLAQPLPAAAAGSGTGLFGFASPGQVVGIDPTTGVVTPVADLFGPNVQGFLTTLAADPSTNRLFIGRSLFIDQTVFPPVTAEEIVTVDLKNGGIQAESPLLAHPVGSLLFDSSTGTLLGITTDSSPAVLTQIDLVTGVETDVAQIPGDGFSNFAIDPAHHTAFVVSESFTTFPATSQLDSIDTAALTLAPGPVLGSGTREIGFDTSSGQLFAVTFNLTPFIPARFVQVNTTTGATTALGTYDFGFFLEPGIAVNSGSHTVYATQDVFDPTQGPITHIASINDASGAGVLGASTNTTIADLIFIAPSITEDSIIADVRNARASGAISNPGVTDALLALLTEAKAARDRGQCGTAANLYRAFINAVTAQAGKTIASSTASQLISEAQFLIANCP